MALYAISGLVLDTAARLAPLPVATSSAKGEHVRLEALEGAATVVSSWLVERVAVGDDRPWLSIARASTGYLLRFHGLADFLIDADRARIRFRPEAGCSDDEIAHLLATQVVAHYVHLQGQLAFHASAVVLEGGVAVGFLGPSGSGKSTLAASLRGTACLLADDLLVVRVAGPTVEALPSYPWVWLRRDSAVATTGDASGSTHVSERRAHKLLLSQPLRAEPQRLRALYLIEREDRDVSLRPMSRRDAVVALAAHAYRIDAGDQPRLRREFEQLVTLLGSVRVARLLVPRCYEALGAVAPLIVRDVNERCCDSR